MTKGALIASLSKNQPLRLSGNGNYNSSISNFEIPKTSHAIHQSISVNKSSDIGTFKSARPSKTTMNSQSATPSKMR